MGQLNNVNTCPSLFIWKYARCYMYAKSVRVYVVYKMCLILYIVDENPFHTSK